MDDLTSVQHLIDAGKTIAGVGEPHRDLLAFGGGFREIALSLEFVGNDLDAAWERETREQQVRARATRKAKLALVKLTALIAELEAQP